MSVLQNDQIPDDQTSSVVEHIVYVHLSVAEYSNKFLQKWRRVNHVTPKNYLDFISSYTDLLKQKDKFFLDQVSNTSKHLTLYHMCFNSVTGLVEVLQNLLKLQNS